MSTVYTTVEAMRLENHDYLMRLGPNVMVDAQHHLEVLASSSTTTVTRCSTMFSS